MGKTELPASTEGTVVKNPKEIVYSGNMIATTILRMARFEFDQASENTHFSRKNIQNPVKGKM